MNGQGQPVLVFGRAGQVAGALAERQSGELPIVCLGRDACDITVPGMVEAAVETHNPRAIINAAAFTHVDLAESDPDAARALNTVAPIAMAHAAARRAIRFVHLSTDYVFDGTKPSPYVEDDPTAPINTYGVTKRDGEVGVLAANPDAVVARTSWVYSAQGRNFLRTILTLAASRDTLRVVDDQIGAPTAADDIADACLNLVGASSWQGGLVHMTAAGSTTWHGFADAIVQETRSWRAGGSPKVIAIPTSEYPTPARRPLNSRLDCGLIGSRFGIVMRPWVEGLTRTLARIDAARGDPD
jgi:dTDP-4-dehydrorhamnose reductase